MQCLNKNSGVDLWSFDLPCEPHLACRRPALIKGCLSASFAVMRLSGSRCNIFSRKSIRLASCGPPSWPVKRALKSFLTVGFAISRRTCKK